MTNVILASSLVDSVGSLEISFKEIYNLIVGYDILLDKGNFIFKLDMSLEIEL